jgi:NDP-sugar pyrophosphorylase family protein
LPGLRWGPANTSDALAGRNVRLSPGRAPPDTLFGNGASLAAAEPFVGEEELFVLVTADHVFGEGALDALAARPRSWTRVPGPMSGRRARA